MYYLTENQKDEILSALNQVICEKRLHLGFCEKMGDPRLNSSDPEAYSNDIEGIMAQIERLELAVEHFENV